MTAPRAFRTLICRVLIGVLLFAQLAVASYACPSLSGKLSMPQGDPASAMAAASMLADMGPDCDQIDNEAANLCAEHCRFGQQSADTAPAPMVFAPVPALLYWLPAEPESTPEFVRSYRSRDAVLEAPPPPHAILHCVFRI